MALSSIGSLSGDWKNLQHCWKSTSALPCDSAASSQPHDLPRGKQRTGERTLIEIRCATGEVVQVQVKTLVEANLDGQELHRAILDGVDMHGASLRHSNLRGASLEGANLSRADLGNAALMVASLRSADLSSARLVGASAVGARFDSAILRGLT
ncbi:pentapeptide repeat-containing protein [Hyalangium sp.]|uniref:pentapeptide repeat-containing protein n=1 Tax=Hyalangium sp. TaxID=2028555 RepID=UPI0039C89A94